MYLVVVDKSITVSRHQTRVGADRGVARARGEFPGRGRVRMRVTGEGLRYWRSDGRRK